MAALDQDLRRELAAPEDERFDRALDVVLRHFGAQSGTVHRLDASDGHLHLLAASKGIPEPVLAVTRRIPLGKGIAGEAAATAKPVSLCNLQRDESGVARPGAKATGVGGALCVPMFRGDEVRGTLGIGTLAEREFTAAETAELLAAGRCIAESV